MSSRTALLLVKSQAVLRVQGLRWLRAPLQALYHRTTLLRIQALNRLWSPARFHPPNRAPFPALGRVRCLRVSLVSSRAPFPALGRVRCLRVSPALNRLWFPARFHRPNHRNRRRNSLRFGSTMVNRRSTRMSRRTLAWRLRTGLVVLIILQSLPEIPL